MIQHAIVRTLAADFIDGVHQPHDDYRMALYTDAADLNATTERYTAKGEVRGLGYESGGIALERKRSRSTDGEHLSFEPVRLQGADVAAAGGLVYNATRGRAMFVLDFGKTYQSTGGDFSVTLPDDLFTLP